MDIFANLAEGIAAVLSPTTLALLVLGVFLGMVIGVMPALGPSAGMAILLPITFGMDPTAAIIMLAAIYYGSMYGGTITSILINTPGESATVATTFDGYPLARQGRAGPALVLAAVGSFVAGTIGAVLLSLFAPMFASVASSFGPPELFLVIVAGLLTLIVVVGGNRLYGAISALLGFGLATVGLDVGTGQQRYTFGSAELISGINFIPVAIGLFGLGELFWSLYTGMHADRKSESQQASMRVSVRSRGFWPTRSDWTETKWTMPRNSLLGFIIGTVPGAGATVASLMGYSTEKALAKDRERFGKGAMRGLVAPETANNAASTGAMVPLLTLGIPGSASTAVLLAGFLLWGLQPGPLLMAENPDFAWGLIASMYLGNVMLVVLNIFFIPAFASIARVPYRIMAPAIVVICMLGTYTVNGSITETWIMLACGVVGFFMKRFGFSPAATVIALVLGPLAEETLRQSMIISGGSFRIFTEDSVSLGLLAVLGALLIGPALYRATGRLRNKRARHAEPETSAAAEPDDASTTTETADSPGDRVV